MTKRKRFTRASTVCVDVDGTLIVNGALSNRVVRWAERARGEGLSVYLWSARGEAYAKEIAARYDVSHLFDKIISKPGYTLDDV